MSNKLPFGKRLKAATAIMRFGTLDATQLGPSIFLPFHNSTFDKIKEAEFYMELPEVSSVINRKGWMRSRGKVRQVSKETGKDIANQQNIVKVLRDPNWFQSSVEFWRQNKIFRELFGESIMYVRQNYGRPITSAQNMYTIPASLVDIKVKDKRPFCFVDVPEIEYTLRWGQQSYPSENSNVIHLNDNRIEMKPEDYVRGMSPLQTLKPVLNNLRESYEARGMLIKSRGVMGLFTPEKDIAGSGVLDDAEKKYIQDQYQKEYGMTDDRWLFMFSKRSLRFQQVSIDDPTKLGLFEEAQDGFRKICDAYGMAPEMFARKEGTTFDNQKWGERKSWENTIIPESEEEASAYNSVFGTDKLSWKIVITYDDIAVLEEKKFERSATVNSMIQALSKALADGAITLVDYQMELGKYGIGPLAQDI